MAFVGDRSDHRPVDFSRASPPHGGGQISHPPFGTEEYDEWFAKRWDPKRAHVEATPDWKRPPWPGSYAHKWSNREKPPRRPFWPLLIDPLDSMGWGDSNYVNYFNWFRAMEPLSRPYNFFKIPAGSHYHSLRWERWADWKMERLTELPSHVLRSFSPVTKAFLTIWFTPRILWQFRNREGFAKRWPHNRSVLRPQRTRYLFKRVHYNKAVQGRRVRRNFKFIVLLMTTWYFAPYFVKEFGAGDYSVVGWGVMTGLMARYFLKANLPMTTFCVFAGMLSAFPDQLVMYYRTTWNKYMDAHEPLWKDFFARKENELAPRLPSWMVEKMKAINLAREKIREENRPRREVHMSFPPRF